MRDMMKTRVLSKRWQGLWALRRDLTFDFSHMCDDVVKILENVRFRNDLEYYARINEDYVKRVDEFMQTFPGEKIDFLRLFYFGDTTSTDESIVDKCVRHAIAKGVEQIDMISASMLPHFRRRFPFWLFPVSNKGTKAYSTLKHLYLRYFVLAPPPDFTGFHNLESLTLECTIVTEDLFKYLLSDPVTPLRVLRLIACRFEFDLEIVSPSLHHFEMIECLHLGTLTISAIKLTVFEYHCFYKYERDLFLNAPQLTNMYFHKLSENQIPAAISQFIATQVENLNLRIVTEKVSKRFCILL
ncbi:putative leucine-rich repeat domain, L domain-containing protein [Rosa chinensis]|uniref:Putative leucine-rich repeat domain, L domain-containing protein n=1 Tax=Rosa chinensis TaxID=74649 RepID=A0A2P6RNN0_ROSCH|nr:putative leucine-rich repeat domain, L domain-containing protein [Rosa chinensis]